MACHSPLSYVCGDRPRVGLELFNRSLIFQSLVGDSVSRSSTEIRQVMMKKVNYLVNQSVGHLFSFSSFFGPLVCC